MKTNIKASIFCISVFMLAAQFAYAELPDLTTPPTLALHRYIVRNFSTLKGNIGVAKDSQITMQEVNQAYGNIAGKPNEIDDPEELYQLITDGFIYPQIKFSLPVDFINKINQEPSISVKELGLAQCMVWQIKKVCCTFTGQETKNFDLMITTLINRYGLTTAEVSSYFKANIGKDIENAFIEAFGFCSVNVSDKYALEVQRTADNKYDIKILTMEANQLKKTTITISNMSELSQYGFSSTEITEIQNNLDFSYQHMYKETVEKLCQIVADFFIEPSQRNYQRLMDLFSHIETYMVINPSYAKYRVNIYILLASFNVAFVLKLEENATARIKSGKLKTETTLTASELKTLLVPAFGGDLRGAPLYNPNSRIFK